MDLTPYVQALRDDLAAAAEASGGPARELAERLTGPMESAFRLALLEALAFAAAEITAELAPGSVEVRLRGRDPEFVVTPPPMVAGGPESTLPSAQSAAWVSAEGDDATMTRINLRLPQDLKERVEEAARQVGLSVNAWLVRSAVGALPDGQTTAPPPRGRRGGDRYAGWVR